MRTAAALVLVALVAPAARAERDPGTTYTPFPILSYAPETSLVLGGLVAIGFRLPGEDDPDSRRSALLLVSAWSLKNQFVFSVGPRLYFGGETWRLDGALEAQYFPDTLYAPGPDSPEDSAEDFTSRDLVADLGGSREVYAKLRVGARAVVHYAAITDVEPGGLLDTDMVIGSDGGLALGLGPEVAWDSRDHDTAPRRGQLHALRLLLFPEALGDFGFTTIAADSRFYVSPWRQHVIAVQATAQLTSGDVPFQAMSTLGGPSRMRGFFLGRYRDKHSIDAQVEYRAPLWWRFGGAVFAGAGEVSGRVRDFSIRRIKAAGGLGVRFALSAAERLNLRFDLGVTSDGDRGAYINLGEAF